MEHKILIAGFGGQGVMLMGELFSYAAFLENKYVVLLPEYGGEQRGGTSNCSVIVSDKPIGSPSVKAYDTVVAMNTPSYVKFGPSVKETGNLLINYPFVEMDKQTVKAAKIYDIPATEIADSMNSSRVANMVVLGALAAVVDCVSKEYVVEAIRQKLGKKRPDLLELNLTALEKGYESIKK